MGIFSSVGVPTVVKLLELELLVIVNFTMWMLGTLNPLQVQYVFLATEPSFDPWIIIFLRFEDMLR